jgi:PAS domain-containing protein
MDMQLERSVWQCLLVEIPAACLIMDVRGSIRFASRTLAEVFGIPPEEKAKAEKEHADREDTESEGPGDSWDSVLSLPRGCKGMLESGEDMRPTDYPLYKTVKNHEVVRGAEFKIRRANGSIGSIRSTSSPVCVSACHETTVSYTADIRALIATIRTTRSWLSWPSLKMSRPLTMHGKSATT